MPLPSDSRSAHVTGRAKLHTIVAKTTVLLNGVIPKIKWVRRRERGALAPRCTPHVFVAKLSR